MWVLGIAASFLLGGPQWKWAFNFIVFMCGILGSLIVCVCSLVFTFIIVK